MTEVTEIIPFTAWQQAVFVVLVIIFVVWVLAWMSKENKANRDQTTKENQEARAFQQAESDKWQKFIDANNEKWRAFSQVQREENNSCMADVNKGLTNLTQVTQGLVTEIREMRAESREVTAALAEHDDQAKEIKHLVEAANHNVAKPRVTKSTTTKQ